MCGAKVQLSDRSLARSMFFFRTNLPSIKTTWCTGSRLYWSFFPKWSVIFTEFKETDNHWSMNWVQFKVPVSHMCLAGAMIACWSPTQEVAGWRGSSPFTVMTYILSLNSVKTFRESSNESDYKEHLDARADFTALTVMLKSSVTNRLQNPLPLHLYHPPLLKCEEVSVSHFVHRGKGVGTSYVV